MVYLKNGAICKRSEGTIMIDMSELKWVAGFLEGDGCFSSAKRCAGRTRQSSIFCVSAAQNGKWPLEKLQQLLGGFIRLVKREGSQMPGAKSHHWVWAATGIRARGIMMTLYPLLSPRRQNKIRENLMHLWGGDHKYKKICSQGHAYNDANTYKYSRDGSARRNCRVCSKLNARKYRGVQKLAYALLVA